MSAEDGGLRAGPPESVAGAPFWAASRERRLVLPWCASCEEPHWYPRGFCPRCLGPDIVWREASGRGVVHAVSVQPKPSLPGLADRVPYAVALVALAEGVQMLLGVRTEDPWAVAIDTAVHLEWEPLDDGRHLPVAVPSPAAHLED